MSLENDIKSKFRSEFQKLRLNIYYTNNILHADIVDLLKKFNLTPQQYNVLRILRGQYPRPATIKLVKERLLDKNSDVSRVVEKLFQKKYITRTECSKDRRKKDLLISSKGLQLLKEIDKVEPELDHVLQKNITIEEAQMLNRLLDKLRGSN